MFLNTARRPPPDHPVLTTVGRMIAFALGLGLTLLGLGLGVTVVFLPAGIVVGILGVLLLLWAFSAPGF